MTGIATAEATHYVWMQIPEDGCCPICRYQYGSPHLSWVRHIDSRYHESSAEMPDTVRREQAVERVLTAARKIHDGPLGGYHPTHIGGCIGVLSETSCACGLADLRFAIRALDGQM